MLRDINFYDALPYRRMMSFDNESQQYVAQIFDLVGCRGFGKTAEDANRDLDKNRRKMLADLIRFKVPIPMPRVADVEAHSENLWNASESSLRDACEALGIPMPLGSNLAMLTLVKAIARYASNPKNAKKVAALVKMKKTQARAEEAHAESASV